MRKLRRKIRAPKANAYRSRLCEVLETFTGVRRETLDRLSIALRVSTVVGAIYANALKQAGITCRQLNKQDLLVLTPRIALAHVAVEHRAGLPQDLQGFGVRDALAMLMNGQPSQSESIEVREFLPAYLAELYEQRSGFLRSPGPEERLTLRFIEHGDIADLQQLGAHLAREISLAALGKVTAAFPLEEARAPSL